MFGLASTFSVLPLFSGTFPIFLLKLCHTECKFSSTGDRKGGDSEHAGGSRGGRLVFYR